MLAECDRCAVRDIACPECVITVIEDGPARLGPEEVRALRALADAGLVAPLRFTPEPAAGPGYRVAAAPVAGGTRRPGERGAGSRPADPRQTRRTGSARLKPLPVPPVTP